MSCVYQPQARVVLAGGTILYMPSLSLHAHSLSSKTGQYTRQERRSHVRIHFHLHHDALIETYRVDPSCLLQNLTRQLVETLLVYRLAWQFYSRSSLIILLLTSF